MRLRPRRPKSRPVSVSALARNGYSYTPFIAKPRLHMGCASICWQPRRTALAVHNVSQRHQRRTEPHANNLIKIGRVFSDICLRTDEHTHTDTYRQIRSSQYSAAYRGRSNKHTSGVSRLRMSLISCVLHVDGGRYAGALICYTGQRRRT